ncbi:hypothetical protein [Methylobacterium sp. E-046]|uniref:hypothetical protein n=1 Tax=Methylobacterium sp. E-046 TaxID=2836576 RepID=UPI001FB9D200|nr:hypothetical protein [Methylobacterium sp. E-046]MCJ2099364.1 hypothetical protein [Methylobacterium sp. E-046]
MSFFRWMFSKMLELLIGNAQERRSNLIAAEKEAGTYQASPLMKGSNFDADYNAAIRMLRERLDRRFPDNHYAKHRVGQSPHVDHGEERARAVDTMSTAVAMALRDGATVKQAAEAGAASVGI